VKSKDPLNQLPRNIEEIHFLILKKGLWRCGAARHLIANCRQLKNSAEYIKTKEIFMAISRDKKNELVAEFTELLTNAKTTAFAEYQNISVAQIQTLRAQARENGVVIKVVKNRLVRVVLASIPAYKDIDTTSLNGMLLYAISSEDEVAPAKVLNEFAKTNKDLVITGGLSLESGLLSASDVNALAALPSKSQLIAEVIAQLLSPVHDVTNALSGNLHALLDGVEAKATS
jgi:large subunit ribosomal protein L10